MPSCLFLVVFVNLVLHNFLTFKGLTAVMNRCSFGRGGRGRGGCTSSLFFKNKYTYILENVCMARTVTAGLFAIYSYPYSDKVV